MHRELDKFYTNRDMAKTLINKLNLDNFDLIIEPSAGDGSFSDLISNKNIVAMDIHPENEKIKKQDWFSYVIPKKYKKVLILGNPPFGKNNKLSLAFLKHAFSFSNTDTIAFVLPNVYKKHTMQSIIPKNFYINKIIDLEKNSFTLDGKPYHVPCSFFIISKDDHIDLRQKTDIISKDFKFSNKNDFDFFIFGAAPKKIIKNPGKNNRGYYVKSKINPNLLVKNFRKINWKGHSSANGGVYWLTKIDIIENYEKAMRE